MATTQTIAVTGGSATLPEEPPAPGGDLVENTRNRTIIVIRNTGGVTRTVTIAPQQTPTRPPEPAHITYPEEATPSIVKPILAGAMVALWALPAAYNDVNGKVHLSYDDTTGLTLSVIVINAL